MVTDDTPTQCLHCNTPIDDVCEECLEDREAWCSASSKLATLKDVEQRVRARAGELFANGREDLAREMRAMADTFKEQVAKAEAAWTRAKAKAEANRWPAKATQ